MTFKQLGILESHIKSFLEQLIGFIGETTDTIEYAYLLTLFGDGRGSKSIMIKYLRVDALTFYNILIGCHLLNELRNIILTSHLVMKFLSKDDKTNAVRVYQIKTLECNVAGLNISIGKKVVELQVKLVACTSINNNLGKTTLDLRKVELKVKPTKEANPFQVGKKPSLYTKLGCQMSTKVEIHSPSIDKKCQPLCIVSIRHARNRSRVPWSQASHLSKG